MPSQFKVIFAVGFHGTFVMDVGAKDETLLCYLQEDVKQGYSLDELGSAVPDLNSGVYRSEFRLREERYGDYMQEYEVYWEMISEPELLYLLPKS